MVNGNSGIYLDRYLKLLGGFMDVKGFIAIALAYLAILILVDLCVLQDTPTHHKGCNIQSVSECKGGN